MGKFAWQGTRLCLGTARRGLPCSELEIDGLEYCLHHVPDELLEEAEEITGWRRCRHNTGQPDACTAYAVEGTNPPACKNHGANAGSNTAKAAASNVVQLRIANAETTRLVEHWDEVINAVPVTDAIGELRRTAGQIVAWKDLMLTVVGKLESSQWRYTKDKMGEQVRAEIMLAGQALDRAERCLVNLAKMDLEGKQLAMDERLLGIIEHAMVMGLQATGADVAAQDRGMQVLRRELRAVS